jgi:hypothetical protein
MHMKDLPTYREVPLFDLQILYRLFAVSPGTVLRVLRNGK